MKKVLCLIAVLFAVNNAIAAKLMFVDIDTAMANFENLELNKSELRDVNIEIRRQLRDNLPSQYDIITEQTVREAKGSEFIKDYEGAIRLGKKLKVDYAVYARLSDLNGYKLSLEVYDTEGNFVSASDPIEGKSFSDLLQSIRENAGSISKKLKGYYDEKYYFTYEERKSAAFKNLVPGYGSIAVMDDWLGATAQWALIGIGAYLMATASPECPSGSLTAEQLPQNVGDGDNGDNGSKVKDSNCYFEDYSFEKPSLWHSTSFVIGLLATISSPLVLNPIRVFTYNKPKPKTAYNKSGNFNLAILPTKNGNGVAYGLMYNKRF